MNTSWKYRFIEFAAYVCLAIPLVIAAWLFVDIVRQGATVLSWEFFTTDPLQGGRQGGIASVLISSVMILAIALMVSIPVGVAVAIWLEEYTQEQGRWRVKAAHSLSIILDVLAGIPSIVYGLFGNAVFCVFLGFGYSILSGGLTLACMVLPIVIRMCAVALRSVDPGWRLGGLALGMTRAAVIRHLLLPAAMPGLAAGILLGFTRASAETAALLFTSGYVDRRPESLFDSGRALSVHIYDLTMNVSGGDRAAYGSAIVLLGVIVIVTLILQSVVDRQLRRSQVGRRIQWT